MQDRRGIVTDLVLCGVAVQTLPFRRQVELASEHGFDAITVVGGPARRTLAKEGLTVGQMRGMAADHGLKVTDVEAAADWLSPPPQGGPRWLSPAFDTAGFLDLTAELGATNLVAVHFGEPAALDLAAEKFAALCDQAAHRGIRIALEFPAFATLSDVATSWDIVRTADRPNGGLLIDIWHHYRSTGDDEVLRSIPGDRIFSVQLSDGLAQPQGTLIEDAAHRLLPGQGTFDVPGFLDGLAVAGVRCPIGVETFDRAGLDADPDSVVRGMRAAMQDVLGGGERAGG